MTTRKPKAKPPPYKILGGKIEVPNWVDTENDLIQFPNVAISDIDEIEKREYLEAVRSRVSPMREALSSAYLRVENVRVPEGLISFPENLDVPVRVQRVDLNSGWEIKSYVNGITNPALITLTQGPKWNQQTQEQKEAMIMALEEKLGVSVYGALSAGTKPITLKVSLDDNAESGWVKNPDYDMGERSWGALKDDVSQINPGTAGRYLKRDYRDTDGGSHHLAYYPDELEGITDVIPFQGKDGTYETVKYGLLGQPVETYEFDTDGNVLQTEADATDGGLVISENAARKIRRAHGLDWDPTMTDIQTNWSARRLELPNGNLAGGTLKGLGIIMPQSEWIQYKRKHGLADDIEMVFSPEALAGQLGNEDISHGRTLWLGGKRHQWHMKNVDGMTSMPGILNAFDGASQFGEEHFRYMVGQAFYAAENAEASMPSPEVLMDMLDEGRGVDDNGRLDVGDEDYMRNLRGQQEIVQRYRDNEVALATGSVYASPGAYEAIASGPESVIASMKRKSGGGTALQVPMFSGKLVSSMHMPGDLEPAEGQVRLFTRQVHDDGRNKFYLNKVIMNAKDWSDPIQRTAHSGQDNDDEFDVILGKERGSDRMKGYVWRRPKASFGGWLYDLHQDDVDILLKADMPVMTLKDDAKSLLQSDHRLGRYLAAGGGLQPDLFEGQVQEFAQMITDANPRVAAMGKMKFAALLLGKSQVATLFNLVGIAIRSGWMTNHDEYVKWAINLSDSLDAELFGIGDNMTSTNAMYEMIADEVLAGKMVDRGTFEGRSGTWANIANYYGERMTEEMEDLKLKSVMKKKYVQEFLDLAEKQTGVLPQYRVIDEWFDATETAVKTIGNMQSSLANGPHRWLRARKQNKAPASGDPYILPAVNEIGNELSNYWNRAYAQNKEFLSMLYQQKNLTKNTSAQIKRRNELDKYWTSMLWQKVDNAVHMALGDARAIAGYQDGMLMASVSQNELLRRARRNTASQQLGEPDNVYDVLRGRIFKAFDRDEERGFFHSEGIQSGPTLTVPYEGQPWMVLDRKTGKYRRRSGGNSWVRYRPNENGLTPRGTVTSKTVQRHLKFLHDMGAEFSYVGDLAGERNMGVFNVRFRKRPEMQFDETQMLTWMEHVFHKGIGYDNQQLPPMWTDPDKMDDLLYDIFTSSGRPAQVGPDTIRYGTYDEQPPRGDFPDVPYETALADPMKRIVPVAGGESMEAIPTRAISNNAVRVEVENIKKNQGSLAGMRRKAQQLAMTQSAQYKPVFGFTDPSVNPVSVTRVGGREDAMAQLVNLFDEMKYIYEREQVSTVQVPRGTGPDGAPTKINSFEPLGKYRPTVDSLWKSPSLGHYTTTRDVTRAYQDFMGWKMKRIPMMAAPGLKHAANNAEAAALVLSDLVGRAQERFVRNEELGVMERYDVHDPATGRKIRTEMMHTRGKSRDLRERVKPMISVRIPTPMVGVSLHPRLQYIGQRRHLLEKWIREYQVPQMFDGDTERMRTATQQQWDFEYAKVQQARQGNNTRAWLVHMLEADQKGFNMAGRNWKPGLFQTADELVDLGLDVKEGFNYASNLFKGLDDQQTEIMARTMVRRAWESGLEKVGIHVVDPINVDTGGVGDVRDAIDRSHIAEDYREFKRIMSNVRQAANEGSFTKMGIELAQAQNLKSVQYVKSHTAIYTQMTPSDIDATARAMGRVMPVAQQRMGALNATAMIDINALWGDRDTNNAIEEIKFAAKKFGWESLKKINQDAYWKARRLQRAGDKKVKELGLQMQVLDSIFDAEYKKEIQARKHGGVMFKFIVRANWHTMLMQGVGAGLLTKTFAKHNVPLEKRWRTRRRWNMDDACRNNSAVGWIRNDADFPSGHTQPPAHPGCGCRVEVRMLKKPNDGTFNGMMSPVVRPRFINLNRRIRRPVNPAAAMRNFTPKVMRRVNLPEIGSISGG